MLRRSAKTESELPSQHTVVLHYKPETTVEIKQIIPAETPEVGTSAEPLLSVGDKLLHKTFGEGEVESLDEKYLFVKFGDLTKKFLRDVAFAKGYLSRC